MVGLCKTLVKEKRLFYYLESSHKIFYTTGIEEMLTATKGPPGDGPSR
jgi:hypothetical protein